MQNFRLYICGFEMMKKIYRTLDTNFASYYIILDYQSVGKFTSKESNSHDIPFFTKWPPSKKKYTIAYLFIWWMSLHFYLFVSG